MIKKLLYIPRLIDNLNHSAYYHKALSEQTECGCPFGNKWHKIYSDEMYDMLGIFSNSPKINSFQKILYIKELITRVRQIRDHDLSLAEEHDLYDQDNYLGDKFCDTSKEHHLESAQTWNEILGPWS